VTISICTDRDFDEIHAVINDAAAAYKGIIPADRWKDPYMPRDELRQQIEAGVVFWAERHEGRIIGVMGVQDLGEVTLIRHAYVRTAHRGRGIGSRLLALLKTQIDGPTLVGTWADATWAVSFYEKHGFRLVTREQKERLLRKYWEIPERQVETSVVLADDRWYEKPTGM
jgi:N-acetylglutamate synthase-like GNAT family acetyltransferase